MVTVDQARAAAAVKPSQRTDAQQAIVTANQGNQSVRNASAEAARQERVHGKK